MSANPVAGATVVELPCGLMKEGKLYTEAEITPMTGLIRKMIARPEIRQNPAKVIDTLLTQCVQSVGPVQKVRKDVTDRLFLGDRDFLVMEIRKASLGNNVRSLIQCDACGAKLDVTVDIAQQVTTKLLKDIPHKIEENMVILEIANPALDINARFRMPVGEDQHAVAMLYRKNPVEANYALYQRCLIEWNGTPINELNPRLFDTLSLPTIDYIDSQFMEMMPGPDMRVPVDCSECGREMSMAMESSDFLFPLPQRGRN